MNDLFSERKKEYADYFTEVIFPHDASSVEKTPFPIVQSSNIGIKFTLPEGKFLENAKFFLPSYGDNTGTVIANIYKWNGDCKKTFSEKPVCSYSFVDFPDNSYQFFRIEDSSVTGGTFVILLEFGEGTVGAWCASPKNADSDDYGFETVVNGEIVPPERAKGFVPVSDLGILCAPTEKVCGIKESRGKWLLDGIPEYDGGVRSEKLYDCGQGLYSYENDPDDDSVMQIIGNTDDKQFADYILKLKKYGFVSGFNNKIGNNLYEMLKAGNTQIYAYYTDATQEARIIVDKASVSVGEFETGLTSDKRCEFYQGGLVMPEFPIYNWMENGWVGCGMFYFAKLSDGSLIVIDGGDFRQYDNAYCEQLLSLLHSVTETKENEKIVISAYFITHAHCDHNSGFTYFLKEYSSHFTLERFAVNYPCEKYAPFKRDGEYEFAEYFTKTVKREWPETLLLKPHTGMKFRIKDALFEILYTHEDITDAKSGNTVSGDINETSTVMMMTLCGKRILITGDVNYVGEKIMLSTLPEDAVKADIIQTPHHVINQLIRLYSVSNARFVVAPQSMGMINGFPHLSGIYKLLTENGCRIIVGGNKTTGIHLDEETPSVFCEIDTAGSTYDGSWNYS